MNLDQCCNQLPVPVVILGEDKALTVKLVSSSTQDPFDLTSATEIIALLLNADGSVLQLKLSLSEIVILSAPGGKFQILITAAQSALLALNPTTGGYQNLEIRITIGGETTIVQLPSSVSVVPKLFPTV